MGIIRSFTDKKINYAFDDEAKITFNAVIKRLESLGLKIIDDIDLGDFNTDNSDLLVGGVQHIDQYLKQGFAPRMNFRDFCQSDRSNRLGDTKKCLARIKKDPGIDSALYRSKRQLFKDNAERLVALMDKHDLIALFYLVQQPYYAEKGAAKEHFTFIASNAGAPAMILRGPMHNAKLPTFFQVIGRRFDEATLLALAAQYDHLWQPPHPHIKSRASGFIFEDISRFNRFKRALAPKLQRYMQQHHISTDTLTRKEWHDFIHNLD